MHHKKYLFVLSCIFLIEFILLAISPHDRADWMLENVLVMGFVIAIFFHSENFRYPVFHTPAFSCL